MRTLLIARFEAVRGQETRYQDWVYFIQGSELFVCRLEAYCSTATRRMRMHMAAKLQA
jgi:hypothetical protein